MALRRRQPAHARELTNGPGKLTQALGSPALITDATKGPDLYLEDYGLSRPHGRSPRSTWITPARGRQAMALLRAWNATYQSCRALKGPN
jgi:3-methyladenine DNA glycosylase Mpg